MISPYLHNRTLGATIELAHADHQSGKTARSFQNYGYEGPWSHGGHFLPREVSPA